MKAHIPMNTRDVAAMGKGRKARQQGHLFDRIRHKVSQYVTFEEDAIFKDPDWPHLWDHKRDK